MHYFDRFNCHMDTDRNHYEVSFNFANRTMFLRQKTVKQVFQNGLKDKVSFLKKSLAQSIIFNTAILVKWIKLCLNFHFPNAMRWVDMFSVLIALKVWTHNGWFYTCMTHVRCTWIMWVGEADGATNNYRGNTFSYWHQNILPLLSYGSSFCHFM